MYWKTYRDTHIYRYLCIYISIFDVCKYIHTHQMHVCTHIYTPHIPIWCILPFRMYHIPVITETVKVNCWLPLAMAEPPQQTSAMQHYWFVVEELEGQLYGKETVSLILMRPEFHSDFDLFTINNDFKDVFTTTFYSIKYERAYIQVLFWGHKLHKYYTVCQKSTIMKQLYISNLSC